MSDRVPRLDQLDGRRIAVWGAGIEGRAALRRLAARADLTLIVDDPPPPAAAELAREFGCPLLTPDSASSQDFALVIRSAGVSVHRPEIAAFHRRGVPVAGLLAIWLAEHESSTTIGVTGTKGKSTTSALCTALLTTVGTDVSFGGNIGVPIIDLPDHAAVHVIEVSSYQASDVRRSPTIGVLTSLEADHLPWHGGLEGYWHDKLNLFEHDGLDHFVTHAALLDGHPAVARSSARRRAHPSDIVVTEGELSIADHPAIELVGSFVLPHNARNLALAVRAARLVSDRVDEAATREVMADYRGLPSRLEVIAVVDGIRLVDDALASNPFASETGVRSMHDQPLVLLAGGADRDVDIAALASTLRDSAHVVAVVLFSETRERWAGELRAAGMPLDRMIEIDTEDVAEAARAASHLLRSGTTLLFSPAAPTPSTIGNYADRSAMFQRFATSLS